MLHQVASQEYTAPRISRRTGLYSGTCGAGCLTASSGVPVFFFKRSALLIILCPQGNNIHHMDIK